ncbi:DUF3494 domain-containing protein [Candidatus Nomurabacteria bacterium]|nr:DUF3494 domain-containing protein [Candidatus Nomurabacteria bacterium]
MFCRPRYGSFPTLTQTGFGTVTLNGTNHLGDATTQGAKTDLTTAYNDAAGQPLSGTISADLGGQTLTAGVYRDNDAPDSLAITGTLILDAAGDANAIFIFQSGSTLVTSAGSEVVLINGAQACNVFWQVGSSATLGTNSEFKGTILALSSITDNGGSVVEGRFLARNGAVTLNNTTIVAPTCVTPSLGGSSYNIQVPVPLINVTKIPDPLDLPAGPGSVTYTYKVKNLGEIKMRSITAEDNKCDDVEFISGDSNDDDMLDINETWIYRCTKVVSKTETNTIRVQGSTDNAQASDTANATVVVGVPLVPPLIHLVKVPNVFFLPATGGAVTYSYVVTNPGTEPLNNVSVIDDKCTGLPGRVLGHPGDLNKNNLLESNETWSFTCLTNLTQTTTNIGTAEGHANGLTALDFSTATVVVASPGLPQTGFADKDNLWKIIAPAGVVLLLISLYFVKRKQTI